MAFSCQRSRSVQPAASHFHLRCRQQSSGADCPKILPHLGAFFFKRRHRHESFCHFLSLVEHARARRHREERYSPSEHIAPPACASNLHGDAEGFSLHRWIVLKCFKLFAPLVPGCSLVIQIWRPAPGGKAPGIHTSPWLHTYSGMGPEGQIVLFNKAR
jgi:hypothetical protein